ncbi:Gfo/Idh/MocA family protein [Oricola cellulosilytica]|uniref:Gfo/Idh/MocA family oxidoreductase n=1 Tax=Oricola cellulosilytica TaxID=1429082 RepID=A0A4R0PJB6_9HYPH|nr:Gfo/Idh/MocA family oxidoreductase [Oricola cellulosilytica]TCD16694.1 Gfo/Idh/MocA family oxidoreductase [Oricola cellulosilytica]
MGRPISIAVAGAGLVGKRHAEAIRAAGADIGLCAIVDPVPSGEALAEQYGVPWHRSLDALFSGEHPDGVILATPNQMHSEGAMACITAGIPALVEKPFAVDVGAAETVVAAAEKAGVALLTGHHRRHNPLIRRARAELEAGAIGRVISVHVNAWLYKPEEYFEAGWRREPGAGPVFLNLIHDIDVLHYLAGAIETVYAMVSSSVRKNPVEETSVIALRFADGVLGTINVSDTIVAPWSWETTARENPAYPPTNQVCYMIGGTHGSLELPGLRVWRNRGKRSWWEPLCAEQLTHDFGDPLVHQIRQFASVIRGEEMPLCSGRDGLEALRVVDAVKKSATTGQTTSLQRPLAANVSGTPN